MVREQLEAGDALEVVEMILARHPEVALGVAEQALGTASAEPADVETLERLMARVTWSYLERRSARRQAELIRSHASLVRPALFWLLGERYLDTSRRDPAAGVRVARVALEVAIALRRSSPEDGTCELQALAWAWLGNAKRLTLDFPGAEAAFRASRQRLPGSASARIVGEIDFQEAGLRWHQSRYEDAAPLLARAEAAFRGVKEHRLLARCLNATGVVRLHSGEAARALPTFREALRIGEEIGDVELQTMSQGNLLGALSRCRTRKARRASLA